jgi:magnesium transporter
MQTREEVKLLAEQFETIWKMGNREELHVFLDNQNIIDIAELVEENPDWEADILAELSVHRAASTFKILETSTQKRIISELPPYKSAELLNELPPDDRTAFLEELPPTVVAELIKTLNPEERKITLSLLGYPEDSVGRLMTTDYIAVKQHWTVLQVLKYIRRVGKNSETIDVIYIINDEHQLVDDLRIREILLVDVETKIEDLLDNRFISLQVNDDQSKANEAFKMNNRVALPVLDSNKVLLGIVTIDDILWVAEEEYSEDIQRIGGSEALDEPYLETPVSKLFIKRVTWLVVLFIGELFTSNAMKYFDDELKKAILLNWFVPLIISSGGNSGSQASTLVIQAMAKGEVVVSNWWLILKRELLSGLLLGLVLAVLGYLRVVGWNAFAHDIGPHAGLIGVAIGISLLFVVIFGTVFGSMFPLLLKRMGADPATSSAPFIATFIDITGIVVYFSICFLLLGHIFNF